jgi:hypothetical protein
MELPQFALCDRSDDELDFGVLELVPDVLDEEGQQRLVGIGPF